MFAKRKLNPHLRGVTDPLLIVLGTILSRCLALECHLDRGTEALGENDLWLRGDTNAWHE